MAAECFRPHPRVPTQTCTCGIYAMSRLDPSPFARANVSVVGSVALWGRVVEHAGGCRGELAYPQRLRVVCAGCLDVGRFVEPDRVVFDDDTPRALCGSHARFVDDSIASISARDVEAALLSRYAVELLPVALSTPFRFPRSSPPAAMRRPSRARTVGAWVKGLIAAIVVVRIMNALGAAIDVVPSAPHAPLRRGEIAVTTVLAHPSGAHATLGDLERMAPPPIFPHLRALCGRTTGGWIAVTDCDSPDAEWMSVATLRSGAPEACLPGAVAVRLWDGRTRCWFRTP
jgi:hypothetical protein